MNRHMLSKSPIRFSSFLPFGCFMYHTICLHFLNSFYCEILWTLTYLLALKVFMYCVLKSDAAAAAAKSLQSCLTLCDPIDSSPPGPVVLGILQARTLKWVAISFFNAWKWKVKVKSLSRVWLFTTPWTAAYQARLSMGFSSQEYWSRVPLPSLAALLKLR